MIELFWQLHNRRKIHLPKLLLRETKVIRCSIFNFYLIYLSALMRLFRPDKLYTQRRSLPSNSLTCCQNSVTTPGRCFNLSKWCAIRFNPLIISHMSSFHHQIQLSGPGKACLPCAVLPNVKCQVSLPNLLSCLLNNLSFSLSSLIFISSPPVKPPTLICIIVFCTRLVSRGIHLEVHPQWFGIGFTEHDLAGSFYYLDPRLSPLGRSTRLILTMAIKTWERNSI